MPGGPARGCSILGGCSVLGGLLALDQMLLHRPDPGVGAPGCAPDCAKGWAGAQDPWELLMPRVGSLTPRFHEWVKLCVPRGVDRAPRAASLPGTAKSSRSCWAPTRSRSRSPTNACTGCAPRSPTLAATSTTTRTISCCSRWARGCWDPGQDPPPHRPPGTATLLQIPLPLGPRGSPTTAGGNARGQHGTTRFPSASFPIP